ncbi:sulfur carrier protein ThiS [Marinobacter sp. M3C]|jgi:sulfur carrier protein|uniref:sulfur carrier protein ThiS n=1 Tax=unclassified Marinobacter TaxID=83889 RepID=UPI00200E21D8|nr:MULTISPECIES: sulfur carrier protein ThiS [unclassified Marinobacter]MCL1478199.1 sulfur carrier protein ThiS [Marinobacter sp.]MCL1480155.1 sulfur carrier protein ThiS [Marinobacter sp.]MCL1483966.1 sulfur carrier protein ThiS [Marinobacter sp.]MCL1486930.1 sulfur carrier protein ThiS [Marinobacter sp.]UQG55644.1 sulfur carrier protein ThiS [Marinobacter sp. M4C]
MKLTVNGEPMAFPAGTTIGALIEHLGLVGKRLAIELNEDIVPRSQHADTALAEGDQVEVVRAIGGG